MNYAKSGDVLIELIKRNPGIYFVLIGKWVEKEVPKMEKKNLLYLERKNSDELVDYYNSSDLSFCLHRGGTGMGIVAEESLACGTPVLLPNTLTMPKHPAVILTSHSSGEINKELKKFFSLSNEERKKISKEARKYAEKYCSDDVWKKEFIKFHLE